MLIAKSFRCSTVYSKASVKLVATKSPTLRYNVTTLYRRRCSSGDSCLACDANTNAGTKNY